MSIEVEDAAAQALLDAPTFSHTRMGNGCWRDVVWIYHFDASSPSHFTVAGATNETQLARLHVPRGGKPLSPTERR